MNFEERFHQLTGKTPYPWQSAFYDSVPNQENVPHRMGLPTRLLLNLRGKRQWRCADPLTRRRITAAVP
jgi:hypothetical protein